MKKIVILTVFLMKIVFMETLNNYIIWKMLHLRIFYVLCSCFFLKPGMYVPVKRTFIYYSVLLYFIMTIIVENVDLYYENFVAFCCCINYRYSHCIGSEKIHKTQSILLHTNIYQTEIFLNYTCSITK